MLNLLILSVVLGAETPCDGPECRVPITAEAPLLVAERVFEAKPLRRTIRGIAERRPARRLANAILERHPARKAFARVANRLRERPRVRRW